MRRVSTPRQAVLLATISLALSICGIGKTAHGAVAATPPKCADLKPVDSRRTACWNYAVDSYNANDWRAALPIFEQFATTVGPKGKLERENVQGALPNLAIMAFNDNDKATAVRVARLSMQLFPGERKLTMLAIVSDVAYAQNDYETATAAEAERLALAPNDPAVLVRLLTRRLAAKQWMQLGEDFAKLEKVSPQGAREWLGKSGRAYRTVSGCTLLGGESPGLTEYLWSGACQDGKIQGAGVYSYRVGDSSTYWAYPSRGYGGFWVREGEPYAVVAKPLGYRVGRSVDQLTDAVDLGGLPTDVADAFLRRGLPYSKADLVATENARVAALEEQRAAIARQAAEARSQQLRAQRQAEGVAALTNALVGAAQVYAQSKNRSVPTPVAQPPPAQYGQRTVAQSSSPATAVRNVVSAMPQTPPAVPAKSYRNATHCLSLKTRESGTTRSYSLTNGCAVKVDYTFCSEVVGKMTSIDCRKGEKGAWHIGPGGTDSLPLSINLAESGGVPGVKVQVVACEYPGSSNAVFQGGALVPGPYFCK